MAFRDFNQNNHAYKTEYNGCICVTTERHGGRSLQRFNFCFVMFCRARVLPLPFTKWNERHKGRSLQRFNFCFVIFSRARVLPLPFTKWNPARAEPLALHWVYYLHCITLSSRIHSVLLPGTGTSSRLCRKKRSSVHH